MAKAGFTPADYEGDAVEVWPEHVEAFELLMQVRTQWRTTMAGYVGLDYTPLLMLMDRRHYTDERHAEVLADVRVMESAALEMLNKQGDV